MTKDERQTLLGIAVIHESYCWLSNYEWPEDRPLKEKKKCNLDKMMIRNCMNNNNKAM